MTDWNYNNYANGGCFTAFAMIFIFIVLWAIFSLIFAFPVMWLWNWLMPVIFKLPTIDWTQAWGLMFLSSLLVKGSTSVNTK